MKGFLAKIFQLTLVMKFILPTALTTTINFVSSSQMFVSHNNTRSSLYLEFQVRL